MRKSQNTPQKPVIIFFNIVYLIENSLSIYIYLVWNT